jgi:hypothetical protein
VLLNPCSGGLHLPCSVALFTSSSVMTEVHWDNVLSWLNADCSADCVVCLRGIKPRHHILGSSQESLHRCSQFMKQQ